jgi:hypothetical protein
MADSPTKQIIDKIRRDIEQKKKSRQSLLDQLAITDAELDIIDDIIIKYDSLAFGAIEAINPTVDPVRAAYDARIDAGCRSDLVWKVVENDNIWEIILGQDLTVWQVVKNEATADFTPFYGLKYYQKPLDRDYGTTIITTFIGSVEDFKAMIAVTDEGGIPPEIRIGDTITDNLNIPTVFSLGDLPEVVGIGSTQAVGFVTTLVGGITTSSNQFYHFGAGVIGLVTTGMVLSLPGILTTNTLITGFSTGTWPVEYVDSSGILTSVNVISNVLTLSSSALAYTEESEFNVGIITTYPALFLSTTASGTEEGLNFTALRISQDVDAGFDYTTNPNAPLTIGIMNSSNLGVGGSIFVDSSGDPNTTSSWDPGKSYVDPNDGKLKNREPKVGAGKVVYNIGTFQWPTITTTSPDPPITTVQYAEEGTIVRVAAGSTAGSSISYASVPPGGVFPPNCATLDSNISTAESNNQTAITANLPTAQSNVNITRALRKERENRQMYAWSLLQGASKLREEIAEGEELLRQLDNMDI